MSGRVLREAQVEQELASMGGTAGAGTGQARAQERTSPAAAVLVEMTRHVVLFGPDTLELATRVADIAHRVSRNSAQSRVRVVDQGALEALFETLRLRFVALRPNPVVDSAPHGDPGLPECPDVERKLDVKDIVLFPPEVFGSLGVNEPQAAGPFQADDEVGPNLQPITWRDWDLVLDFDAKDLPLVVIVERAIPGQHPFEQQLLRRLLDGARDETVLTPGQLVG